MVVPSTVDLILHELQSQGIWLARSSKISEPATFVLDLEGSDGRERGEDDTNFERQSALFALAVSWEAQVVAHHSLRVCSSRSLCHEQVADVLLVNIWCHDIGREQGSGKPLLKTIFQV